MTIIGRKVSDEVVKPSGKSYTPSYVLQCPYYRIQVKLIFDAIVKDNLYIFVYFMCTWINEVVFHLFGYEFSIVGMPKSGSQCKKFNNQNTSIINFSQASCFQVVTVRRSVFQGST